MADRMIFPKTIQEFIKEYAFKDKKEYYTNGSMLIPVFRMEQAHAYYSKEIRNNVIDEFIKRFDDICDPQHDRCNDFGNCNHCYMAGMHEIAEQMKEV